MCVILFYINEQELEIFMCYLCWKNKNNVCVIVVIILDKNNYDPQIMHESIVALKS